MEGNLRIKRKGNLHGKKIKYRCGIWTVLFFLWTASAMTGCARREEVFLEEMDSDEENSNRKAGEESTAYENNVAAGENPKNSLLFQMQDQREIQKIQLWICCQKRQFHRKYSLMYAELL